MIKKREKLSIGKLKHTFPWVIYYLAATVNFFFTTYHEIITNVPFGIINNPSLIFPILFLYMVFCMYIQSPPSILIHTKQIHHSLVKKLALTIFFCDLFCLIIIMQTCTTKKYILTLIMGTLLIQIVVYSKYIIKLIIPSLRRTPIENYISIYTHLEGTELVKFGFLRFYMYFYIIMFLFIMGFVVSCLLALLPVTNLSFSEFILKILYCYWGFYSFMYIFISVCSISFYLIINSGCNWKESFGIISKICIGNMGVCIYMGILRILSMVEVFLRLKNLLGKSFRDRIDRIGDRYFRNIIFYNKIGFKGIIVICAILEIEPHQVIDFFRKVEEPGTYPYVNSFSAAKSENTTEKISLFLSIVILIPLSAVILFGRTFTEEFTGYYKIVLTMLLATYAIANVGYIYTETMHYVIVLTNIQGAIKDVSWIDKYLNVI